MSYTDHLKKLWRPDLQKDQYKNFARLNHNEAPFAPAGTGLNQYPDPYPLYESISSFYNIPIRQILLTCGSEQGIRYVFDTFLSAGDEVIYAQPSFGMYDVFAHYNNAAVGYLHYNSELALPVKAVIKSITDKTRLLVLSNPNNPTGTVFSLKHIRCIARRAKTTNTMFLLDEAYYHYYSLNTISLLKSHPCMIIARSFSKAWGLAGARVGFLISAPDNINVLRKQKPMDEINSLSVKACISAINSPSILDKNVEQVKKWKQACQDIEFKDLTYIPTEGNFLLFKTTKASYYEETLFKNNILVRTQFNHPSMDSHLRIGVGNDEIMEKVLSLLHI